MKGWLAGCRQKGRLMDGGMEGWRADGWQQLLESIRTAAEFTGRTSLPCHV